MAAGASACAMTKGVASATLCVLRSSGTRVHPAPAELRVANQLLPTRRGLQFAVVSFGNTSVKISRQRAAAARRGYGAHRILIQHRQPVRQSHRSSGTAEQPASPGTCWTDSLGIWWWTCWRQLRRRKGYRLSVSVSCERKWAGGMPARSNFGARLTATSQ